jgi:hypothetical protein
MRSQTTGDGALPKELYKSMGVAMLGDTGIRDRDLEALHSCFDIL